jgi:hypothetical protein
MLHGQCLLPPSFAVYVWASAISSPCPKEIVNEYWVQFIESRDPFDPQIDRIRPLDEF